MVYVKMVNFFTLTNMNGLTGSTQREDRFLSIEARQIEKPLSDLNGYKPNFCNPGNL